MRSHVTAFLLCATLTAPAAALAGEMPRESPAERRAAIGQRIRSGIRTGDLTAREAGRLRRQIAALRMAATSLRADGLDARERHQLRSWWRGISRQVFRLRHNDVRKSGR